MNNVSCLPACLPSTLFEEVRSTRSDNKWSPLEHEKKLEWGAAKLRMRLWSVYADISRAASRRRSSDIVPGRGFDARSNEPKVSIEPYRRLMVFSAVEVIG